MHVQILRNAHRDIKILWLSTFLRQFAYGSSTMVLTLFLKALGVSEDKIGIFMTLTLIGDTVLSISLTWHADKIGRRLVMVVGCLLMFGSGVVFALSDSYFWLVIASVFGVISPSGDEVGPFRAIEGSAIAHLTPLDDRPDVFSLQWMLGTAGSALGSLITGLLISKLVNDFDYELVDAYRYSFYLYAIVGLIKLVLMLFLSKDCELQKKDTLLQDREGLESSSRAVLTEEEIVRELEEEDSKPAVNESSNIVILKLLSVFMLDSLGSGFMTTSWIVYFFRTEYLVSAFALGVLFFWTNILNSISAIPSSFITKKLGPIRATVVAQIPSAIFLTLVPFMPSFSISAILTLMYYSTSAMDVVPRQVLLSNIVKKHELTKVMGIVNIGKTFARCIGPIFTGRLAEKGMLSLAFVISGLFVFLADLLLMVHFGLDL